MSGYVHMNVGGTFYLTSRATLTKCSDSMLSNICKQEWSQTDREATTGSNRDNPVMIDRDGVMFKHILDFLRNDDLFVLPSTDSKFLAKLYVEANFYGILDLCEKIQRALVPHKIKFSGGRFVPEPGNNNLVLFRNDREYIARVATVCTLHKLGVKIAEGDVYLFMADDDCSCQGRGRNILGSDFACMRDMEYPSCDDHMAKFARFLISAAPDPGQHLIDVQGVITIPCHDCQEKEETLNNALQPLKNDLLEYVEIKASVMKVYGSGAAAHVDVKFSIGLPNQEYEEYPPDAPIHMALSDFELML